MQQRSHSCSPSDQYGGWGLWLRLRLIEAPLSVWVFLAINSQLTGEEESYYKLCWRFGGVGLEETCITSVAFHWPTQSPGPPRHMEGWEMQLLSR